MAPIPKATKTNHSMDHGITYELIFLIVACALVLDSFISTYVHKELTIFTLLFAGIVVAYLVLPSAINEGRNGYERIMICLRFSVDRNHMRKLK